jgi:uncharacterized membrane protein
VSGLDIPGWLVATVPLWKALHIIAMSIWCGGLIVLPMMLALHDPAVSPGDYRIIRHSTHLTYTMVVTPAAVVAVIAGTWLIFLRQVFEPWLFAKLALVAALMALHATIGHVILRISEAPGRRRPPSPYWPIGGVLACATGILVLVLAKPDLAGLSFPHWLVTPQGRQLPFVPSP